MTRLTVVGSELAGGVLAITAVTLTIAPPQPFAYMERHILNNE